jgi:hypothetical protein
MPAAGRSCSELRYTAGLVLIATLKADRVH